MASRSFIYHTILVGWLLLAVIIVPARAQSVPQPDREQLLNGLTILYSPRHGDPNVVLKLRVRSGAAFDLAGKAGIMSLLGDAFFPEAETREYVTEQLGGRLEVSTSYDAIDITISGKATETERMIEMLRNAVVNTNLSAENVARVRDARIKQLNERPQSPSDIADRAIAVRLFGSFPYAHPAAGTAETLAKVDRADLMQAQDRFLHADNTTLVVIGGVEKPRLMRALRQLLGPWQKGDRTIPATFRQPNSPDARVLLVDQGDAKTAEIRLAVRGLARADRDVSTASLLAQIVKERLQSALPDISSPFARHEAHMLPGILVLGGSVPSISAGKAISTAQELMRALAQSGPSVAEVERARAELLARANQHAAESDFVADAWLDSETYKLSPQNANDISRITPMDVQRVATRLFKDAPSAIVVVGNSRELKAGLGTNVDFHPATPEVRGAADPLTPPKKP